MKKLLIFFIFILLFSSKAHAFALSSDCTPSSGNFVGWTAAGGWICSAPVAPTATVSTLPTCNSAARGTLYIVTDALIPAALATVAGSGAVVVGVICNGTNWIVQ